jgi:Zn-dependent protease
MPAFRLFGFPVRVKLGFVVFLALVVVWNPEVGWKFGIAVTVFSLIHEFGHALAARRLGAEPEIALDFLAGSTRYTPPRPITPIERAGVAVAGPGIEVATGLIVLACMGVNPLDVSAVFDSTLSAVVWIAGPVFGLMNLLPVLPLDGGHVLAGAIETFWPSRGQQLATITSAAITIALAVVALARADLRWLAPFALMLVGLQLWPYLPTRFWGRKRAGSRAELPEYAGQPAFQGEAMQVSRTDLPENAPENASV